MGGATHGTGLRTLRGALKSFSFSGSSRDRHRSMVRWGLLAVVVGIAVYSGGLTLPGFGESLRSLRQVGLPTVVVAFLLEVGAVLTLANVFRSSLRAVGDDLGYGRSLGISMSAFTVSRVVPAGGAMGAVVAARRMTAEGASSAAASAAVVLMGTCAMLTLGALVTLGAVSASLRQGVAAMYTTALLAGLVAIAIGAVLAGLRSERVRRTTMDLAERVARPFRADLDGWRRSLEAVATEPPAAGEIATIVGWSAINWTFDILVVWLLFRDVGLDVPLGVVLIGYGAANLGAAVPLTPGGLGVVEVGMAGTYTALGVPAATAIAVVLAYRLFSFWLPTIAGVPVYLRGPRPRRPDDDVRVSVAPEEDLSPPARPALALQGGMEHLPGCEPIDEMLLGSLGAERPHVALVPAASSARKRPHAVALARSYWRELGARVTVADLDQPDAALAAVEAADLVVLSGGDPLRLRRALSRGPVWQRVLERRDEGLGISGASAGAMVLASWIPRLRPPDLLRLEEGLGLLGDAAVAPHYELPLVRRWALRTSRRHPELTIVGIAERTGLVAPTGRDFHVIGQGSVTLLRDGVETRHGRGERLRLNGSRPAVDADDSR
ncbi:MAG: flippase-like domain-containing protein [Nitriliruptorales bacterium]